MSDFRALSPGVPAARTMFRAARGLIAALVFSLSWPAVSVVAQSNQPAPEDSPEDSPLDSRKLLRLFGAEDSYWLMLEDGREVGDEEQESLLKFMYAIRRFSPLQVHRFRNQDRDWKDVLEQPEENRGEILDMKGRVRQVTKLELKGELALRFELDRFYLCDLELENGQAARAYSLEVPKQWLQVREPPEGEWRCGFSGFFMKLDSDKRPVFLTRHMAWRPPGLLGDLEMDAGLFDHIRNAQPLSAAEGECFYQMLAAVARTRPRQLFRRSRMETKTLDFQISHIRDWIVFLSKLRQSAASDRV
ncbi:MAG: hypothetical protein N2C14_34295, partial [Planctomycetales bacterium]